VLAVSGESSDDINVPLIMSAAGERMSIQELESAVRDLPSNQLFEFAKWFEAYFADEWDRQIELDAKSGKLDKLAEKADADFRAGKCAPL